MAGASYYVAQRISDSDVVQTVYAGKSRLHSTERCRTESSVRLSELDKFGPHYYLSMKVAICRHSIFLNPSGENLNSPKVSHACFIIDFATQFFYSSRRITLLDESQNLNGP